MAEEKKLKNGETVVVDDTNKKGKVAVSPEVLNYLQIPIPREGVSKADFLFQAINILVTNQIKLEVQFKALEKRVSDSNKARIVMPGSANFKA
jgi:hypothetical protein